MDKKEKWQQNAPTIFYHGTSKSRFEKIKREGLKTTGIPIHSAIGGGLHAEGIYLCDRPELVQEFTKDNVILKVRIPKKSALILDPEFTTNYGTKSYEYVKYMGNIPPSYITPLKVTYERVLAMSLVEIKGLPEMLKKVAVKFKTKRVKMGNKDYLEILIPFGNEKNKDKCRRICDAFDRINRKVLNQALSYFKQKYPNESVSGKVREEYHRKCLLKAKRDYGLIR